MLRPATPLTKAFGRVVRARRLAAGLSQERLAFASGIHPTLVSQIERGLTVPSLRTVELLSHGLDEAPHKLVKAAEESASKRRQGERPTARRR